MAPMALTRDLMPLFVAAKPSRVVNVGSIFGDIASREFTCYSAAIAEALHARYCDFNAVDDLI